MSLNAITRAIKLLAPLSLSAGLLLGCNEQSSAPVDAPAPKRSETAQSIPPATEIQAGQDYHSFANAEEVEVKHLNLDLSVDFDERTLSGSVELNFVRHDKDADTLVLDTRDIQIHKVTHMGAPVPFNMGNTDKNLGTPLSIELPEGADKVTVHYTTSPDASGLQWLTPAQTAGKQQPFLFSQAQAIHARSFIPLQDSPKVRVTYDATIRTPKALLAVMSASNDPDTTRDGVYEFSMPQAIPSYLIAIAVGDLHFKPMGERTGVYAEPSWLERAAAEFADTEAMLEATEERYGPYSWDRYDLLILPPSFPFGGMENPRLSFITPTVIAGDKSLVALIAHELAHSWSGNTVTNATWRDLWLNEGFTTYLTYRIMELIYGTDRYKMEAVLGLQDLEEDIQALPAKDEILAIDLRGRDPDAVFSNIPYEKGALFLREIEEKIGRDAFDAFLMQYFSDFAFNSITTDEFIAYLDKTLLVSHKDKLDRERILALIFAPGIPEGAPTVSSDAFSIVDNARSQWLAGEIAATDIKVTDWTYHQWKYFLSNMPAKLSQGQLEELDGAFALTQNTNNEIVHSWLLIAINNQYYAAWPRLHDYLVSIGRNKLVKPLYQALSKTEEGKQFAKKAFEQARPGYHPLTVKANEGFVQ